jgi:hypothetical protein
MSHHDMHSLKTVQLSMTEMKELNFHLDAARQNLEEQEAQAEDASKKSIYREKAEFLTQIMDKING